MAGNGPEMLRFAGKALIILGFTLIVLGGIFFFAHKVPHLGRLPGDVTVRRGNFTFYFPLTTSIIVSIVLSVILYLLSKK